MEDHNKKDYDRLVDPYPISFGWKTTMSNKGFFILFSLIMGVLYAIQMYIENSLNMKNNEFLSIEYLLNYTSSVVINAIIILGGANICLKFYDGVKANITDIYVPPKIVLFNFLASILYTILVIWPIILVGGIFLALFSFGYLNFIFGALIILIFGIPAIIYSFNRAISYQFYSYILIDKKVGPINSLKYSRLISKNHVMDIFGLDFSLGLINLAGLLCLGVGLLFTIPTTFLAISHRYAFLRDLADDEIFVEPELETNEVSLESLT